MATGALFLECLRVDERLLKSKPAETTRLSMNNCAAVIVCAGKGEQVKLGYNKIFTAIKAKRSLRHCLDN